LTNILPGFEDLKPKVVTSVDGNTIECVGVDGRRASYVLCVEPTGSLKAHPLPVGLAMASTHHQVDQV
jgi:hypothetical protein